MAQTIPLADGWGMHSSGGWWILGGVLMMLFMGAMMWMMMRGMHGGSSQSSSAPDESPDTTQSAVEILERRLAEGDISVEEYGERLEVLRSQDPQFGSSKEPESVTTPGAGERSER